MSKNIGALIQTFTPRSRTVGGSDSVVLKYADLYFKTKPRPSNNKSGIASPGVVVYICKVVANQPDPSKVLFGSKTRIDFTNITAVSDASVATRVSFKTPVRLETDASYGLVIVLEDPDYQLWQNVQGNFLVGTVQQSSGSTGLNSADCSLYEYTSAETLNPLINNNLKFSLAAAQITSNTQTYDLVNERYEFIETTTTTTSLFKGGERVFQLYGNVSANVTNYQAGTLTLQRGNTTVVGNGTTFSTTLTSGDYIIVTDGSDHNTMVQQVAYVANNTSFKVAQAPKFNYSAMHYIKSVTGIVHFHDFIHSSLQLRSSTANSTMLFSDSSLNVTGFANGSGYSNTDVIVISGGTTNAYANVVTNGSGAILSINFSNVGYGFPNTSVANVWFSNSTSHNSAGTGASLTLTVGGKLFGIVSKAKTGVSAVVDQPVHQFDSEILTIAGASTSTNLSYSFAFSNTASNTTLVDLTLAQPVYNPGLNSSYVYPATIMSRSHEVLSANNLLYGTDNKSAIFQVTLASSQNVSNSLFATPYVYGKKFDLFVFKNIINNDTTNEVNPQGGNASCKHISTSINFANTAEDFIVYVDGWKPSGTEFAVFAKLWNQHDNDAFDDKYWTPLIQVTPDTSVYSSLADQKDTVTYTYQLMQTPPSTNTITGSISATNGQANITGAGTTFTTDLTIGNLFKVYDPNQPNTNYWVGVVNSVVNNTLFTADIAVGTANINSAGLAIDNLQYNYTAFNNINNDNVVRYYTSTGSSIDGFDTVAVKVVLLSANVYVAPIIHDIRALGVSA